MTLDDLHWLAGLLEGEGCFGLFWSQRTYGDTVYRYQYPAIQLNMTDEDVVARAARLLRIGYRRSRRVPPNKDTFQFRLSGGRALKSMVALLPLMGLRRQRRIREIMSFSSERLLAKQSRLAKAVALRRDGCTLKEIANQLGCRSHVTAIRLLRRAATR